MQAIFEVEQNIEIKYTFVPVVTLYPSSTGEIMTTNNQHERENTVLVNNLFSVKK